MGKASFLLSALGALALASPALGQSFPADGDWVALECGGLPSWDPLRDEPGAQGERDAVGDATAPAVYLYADATHVFFRMRVDANPASGDNLRPFGWGSEMDIDGSRDSYEVLTIVDGISDDVQLHRNTVQRVPGDPTDPPEELVRMYPAAMNARAVEATGVFASSFNDDPDFFIDWAIPLGDMEMVGVEDTTTLALVFGTSSSTSGLDADIVCHNGATGDPTLQGSSTDPTQRDGTTATDTDGDGLADTEEVRIGTDSTVADTDGDGFDDGVEIRVGTDPLDPDDHPPTIDSDGDGWSDEDEIELGTDPNDPTNFPQGQSLRGGGGLFGCTASGAGGGMLPLAALLLLGARRRRRSGSRQ